MYPTELSKKMNDLADRDNLPLDHELRTKALEFQNACEGYFGNPQTVSAPQFLGCYARARKVWCRYTGESLV